jgi:hypothetical protein
VQHLVETGVHARRGKMAAQKKPHAAAPPLEQAHQLHVLGDLIAHGRMIAGRFIPIAPHQKKLSIGRRRRAIVFVGPRNKFIAAHATAAGASTSRSKNVRQSSRVSRVTASY